MAVITCKRCDKEGAGLADPPMGGRIGETILAQTCAVCWGAWLEDQARFINHYGLQMADPDDRKKLMQAMKDYLQLETA